MSAADTFVVQVPGGDWETNCCADIHGVLEHIGSYPTRRAAEAAARLHRSADADAQVRLDARIAQCCPTCGRPR